MMQGGQHPLTKSPNNGTRGKICSSKKKLASGLEEFAVRSNEIIVDIDCGTGNLTQVLLEKLSSEGR